jgi:hypothetical protein
MLRESGYEWGAIGYRTIDPAYAQAADKPEMSGASAIRKYRFT